jgi:small subunit ribosomal protein S1
LPSDLSKLEPEERESFKIGDEISVYIVNTNEPDGLEVSIHRAKLNQDWVEAEALMKSGEIIEVTVAGYNRGGAIAPYGQIRGFIPASQLTGLMRGMDERQRQQVLSKLRDKPIATKVIEVDRQRRRLVFSQRAAQKEWAEKQRAQLMEKIKVGDVLEGTVTSVRDFGVFVDLGGVDGLVHISELAWHRVKHPRDIVKVGEKIEVAILKIEEENQRIALSRRQVVDSPWTNIDDKYGVGKLVEGRVVRIMDYGAFIQLEPGVEGLLHISQLSPIEVKHTSDIVRDNETHLLRVISIDDKRQRIGLSLKAVTVREQMDWMAQQQSEANSDSDEIQEAGELISESSSNGEEE